MAFYTDDDLEIYKCINECVRQRDVVSYDESILKFLSTYTDSSNENIKTNYLDALNSSYSLDKTDMFIRYLALGMRRKFELCKGKLISLHGGYFSHSWIETKDSVYDVLFPGKWPKNLYYGLFSPKIEEIVDLDTDEKYIQYKSFNTMANECDSIGLLQYTDWYNYKLSNAKPNVGQVMLHPKRNYFPKDFKKGQKLEILNFVQEEWNRVVGDENIVVPEELLSIELNEYLEQFSHIRIKRDIYQQFIKFIVENRTLYEENKNVLYSIGAWEKAIAENYSGTFCEVLLHMPIIMQQINERKDNFQKQITKDL